MSKKKVKTDEELLQDALVPVEEQPYEIPSHWKWVRLELIESKTKNIKPVNFSEETFELYSVPSFEDGLPEFLTGNEINSDKQIVTAGTVLLCKINPRINRVWKVDKYTKHQQIASTEWIALPPNNYFIPKYLMFVLRSPYFRQLLTSSVSGVGGSLTRARPKEVYKYPIPLPPLDEQKRIALKIQRMLDKINQSKQLIEEAKQTFELRRGAILEKAFSGELTRRWREENNVSFDWDKKTLESLVNTKRGLFDGPFGSNLKSDDYTSFGVRVVRLENIKYLEFDNTKESFISNEKFKTLEKHELYENDIIISSFLTDSIRSCLLPKLETTAINKADCFCIRPNQLLINNHFLNYYFASNTCFEKLKRQIHGATRPRINLGQLKVVEIPLPTLSEQNEIVRLINNLLIKENTILDYLEMQTNSIENSLLFKAFKGKL